MDLWHLPERWHNLVRPPMSVKVFITQEAIDSWLVSDRVQVEGDVMAFRGTGASARLVPAYHFLRLQAGDDVSNRLLGRVKVTAAVLAMGAEAYLNSVILGETAYEAEAGFVAKPSGETSDQDLLSAVVHVTS